MTLQNIPYRGIYIYFYQLVIETKKKKKPFLLVSLGVHNLMPSSSRIICLVLLTVYAFQRKHVILYIRLTEAFSLSLCGAHTENTWVISGYLVKKITFLRLCVLAIVFSLSALSKSPNTTFKTACFKSIVDIIFIFLIWWRNVLSYSIRSISDNKPMNLWKIFCI